VSERRIYQDETIYLPDLARTEPVITATFENCDIRGPAVVALLGDTRFEGVTFKVGAGDIETILFEVPEGSHKVGLIGLRDCRFIGGRTENIGFVGTPVVLDRLRAVTPKPHWEEKS
jgi:hypothetical protein